MDEFLQTNSNDESLKDFIRAILESPSDDLDDLLQIARSYNSTWDEEDDKYVYRRSEELNS